MGNSMAVEKAAVAAGYWHLFRFNPALAEKGENPFSLDSKEPTGSYLDFIKGETRYSALSLSFPEKAKELFERAEDLAKEKYKRLEKLVEYYKP